PSRPAVSSTPSTPSAALCPFRPCAPLPPRSPLAPFCLLRVRLRDFRGSARMVSFHQSWCPVLRFLRDLRLISFLRVRLRDLRGSASNAPFPPEAGVQFSASSAFSACSVLSSPCSLRDLRGSALNGQFHS